MAPFRPATVALSRSSTVDVRATLAEAGRRIV